MSMENKEKVEALSVETAIQGNAKVDGETVPRSLFIPMDSVLDPKIEKYVRILQANGIETFESCQAGEGHCFLEPTIRFHGNQYAGWQALSIALVHAFPISELRRYWSIQDGEPVGPKWEMTLYNL